MADLWGRGRKLSRKVFLVGSKFLDKTLDILLQVLLSEICNFIESYKPPKSMSSQIARTFHSLFLLTLKHFSGTLPKRRERSCSYPQTSVRNISVLRGLPLLPDKISGVEKLIRSSFKKVYPFWAFLLSGIGLLQTPFKADRVSSCTPKIREKLKGNN